MRKISRKQRLVGKTASQVSATFRRNDERTSSESGARLTQTCSLSDLRSRLISRRRRTRDPVRKARLQLTIDQLGSLISGKHGPDLPQLIKRQIALVAS